MTFRLISSVTLPLTRELAEEQLHLEASPGARQLKPKHLEYLRQRITIGWLTSFKWARATIKGRPGIWRVDGYHSAAVLCELSEEEFPKGRFVHMDYYECTMLLGVADACAQHDVKISVRTSRDVSSLYQAAEPKLEAISKSWATLAINGIAWYDRNIDHVVVGVAEDKYRGFHDIRKHSYLQWFGQELLPNKSELQQVGVSAAIWATYQANEIEAKRFWGAVAHGGDDNAPAAVLDSFLRRAKEKQIKVGKGNRLGGGNYYQACIFVWNAFRKGKAIKTLKWDTKSGLFELIPEFESTQAVPAEESSSTPFPPVTYEEIVPPFTYEAPASTSTSVFMP
jgi:hypothetical protein